MIKTIYLHFSYTERGKLTIEVKIRIFPNFPVTSVEKSVLSHGLIIDREIDLFAVSRHGPTIAFPARISK